MAIASKIEITNAQDIADAIEGQAATVESNLPSAPINLTILAYPIVLLVLILGAAAYFVLGRSDPSDVPASKSSAIEATSQLDVGTKNR